MNVVGHANQHAAMLHSYAYLDPIGVATLGLQAGNCCSIEISQSSSTCQQTVSSTASWSVPLTMLTFPRQSAHVNFTRSMFPMPIFHLHACQFRRPQTTKVAVEIDAAAITEDCALVVEAKPTLDIGTARQLVSSLYTIRYV